MAQQQPDLTGRRAGLWDIEEWVRRGEAGAAFAALTSNAAGLASFELFTVSADFWLIDVLLSASSAVTWTLWTHGYPPQGVSGGSNNGLSGPGAPVNAPTLYLYGNVAPAPGGNQAMSGSVPGGFFGSILGRAKLFAPKSNAWNLTVGGPALSANVVTFVYLTATA